MIQFQYKARDRQGREVNGTIEMDTKELAVTSLREQGYYVTEIKEVSKRRLSNIVIFQSSKTLKAKDLALFCRQFAIQLEAGLSLTACLELLEEQSADEILKNVLRTIRLDVASGMTFTNAVEKHKEIFPHEFIYLISAGEIAGELPAVLEQLAVYYEREDELRKKLSEALMYPIVIASIAVIVVIALIFFVLPMLIKNFSAFGVQTPRITQVILDARDFLIDFWYVFVGFIVFFIVVIKWYLKTKRGCYQKDLLKLKLPIMGKINQMVIFSRISRVLGLLLASGISMVKSLEITERLITNVWIRDSLNDSRLAVEKGQGLTEPLKKSNLFPAMFVQMVAVGEETGNLEQTLKHLSDYYDKEVNFTVSAFTKLLEPVMMVVLAIVVLFVLVSVYLPMIQMVTQL